MANADTPGYRARAMQSFGDTYVAGGSGLRATRSGHQGTDTASSIPQPHFSDSEASPNGNTVSLEQEMVSSIEIQREHSRALAIYKHSLDVLRMSIGRR
jgi:flagellar basal-body rod protein FlgB